MGNVILKKDKTNNSHFLSTHVIDIRRIIDTTHRVICVHYDFEIEMFYFTDVIVT